MIIEMIRNANTRIICLALLMESKLKNERGSYNTGAVIGMCILIILAVSMREPITTFGTAVLTKLTAWGLSIIDTEIA